VAPPVVGARARLAAPAAAPPAAAALASGELASARPSGRGTQGPAPLITANRTLVLLALCALGFALGYALSR